jgi:hypothetical protein
MLGAAIVNDSHAWLEHRFARGHLVFDALTGAAGRDPAGVWALLADPRQISDCQVSEALSSGIAAGVHSRRFPRVVGWLASGINDELPHGAPRLPSLRTLLSAAAVAASHREIERALRSAEW